MDRLRSLESEIDYPEAEEPRMDPPPVIGSDERRMHVRAYNYWVSLLDGRAYPSMVELALKLRERGAELVIAAHSPEILELATRPLHLPAEADERLSPLLAIIPGQLLAYHLALARGHNPDRPRGLSKVTLTR